MNKNYLFKCFLFLFTIVKLAATTEITPLEVAIFLAAVSSDIVVERFKQNYFTIIAELLLISYGTYLNYSFSPLYGVLAFNFIYSGYYLGLILSFISGIYFAKNSEVYIFIMSFGLSMMYGYIMKLFNNREKTFKKSFDYERQLRYELESTKARLLNSEKEIEHITEIRERNRIARELHDNIGHSMAGILMELQVVQKLYNKDDETAKKYLESSIEGVSNSLTVIRNTAYNIKPKEEIGIGYIEKLIKEFKFCNVDFKHTGDALSIPPNIIGIINTNIKEALTNASKYSNADNIIIRLDVNEKFVRLYIKDNGKGAVNIKEGLGLSGMRERVKNAGGSISISGEDGFLIVCIIPLDFGEGGSVFEGFSS